MHPGWFKASVYYWLLFATILAAPSVCHALELSPAEKQYLQSLGPVQICVDPDWEPYEQLTVEGKYVGIAADLVRLAAQRAGITLHVVPTRDWNESIAFSKAGKCDALAFLNRTPLREEWLLFTAPYFVDTNVVVTRVEHDHVSDLKGLSGEVMVLPRGTSVEERVRRDYPNLTVMIVDTEADAFRMVEGRQADMTLRSLTMAAFTIKKEGWFNLKIAGEIPAYANLMRMGVVRDKPELRDILDRAVGTITEEDVREVVNRHVSITVSHRIQYELFAKILAVFIIVAGLGYYRMKELRKINRKLEALSEQLQQDVQRREQAEKALRESEERYRTLIETALEGIVVVEDGKFVFANPKALTISGYGERELLGMAFPRLVLPEDHDLAISNYQNRMAGKEADQRYQLRLVHKSGALVWVELSVAQISWNGVPATLTFITDITRRKEVEEKIKYMAQHDSLTGLPNRALFSDRLARSLALAKREGRRMAVMFVDLDRFKPVNDEYGHDVGDLLLKAVAGRLSGLLRKSDTAARIGGDEFILLLTSIEKQSDVQIVAAKIRQAMREPFRVAGHELHIRASIGVAIFPDDGETEIELCKHSDKNMYLDKNRASGL